MLTFSPTWRAQGQSCVTHYQCKGIFANIYSLAQQVNFAVQQQVSPPPTKERDLEPGLLIAYKLTFHLQAQKVTV